MEFFQSAGNIVMVVVGFGFIIFVHELGHFLLAKRIGAKVDVFSVGFGPKIIGFVRGGTDYRLSLLPLGGYVKIKGQGVGVEKSESPDDFERKPVGKRMQVLFAGVAMNFLFAIPLCVAVLLIGRPVLNTVITDVRPGSSAFVAGLEKGDKILSIVASDKKSVNDITEGEWNSGAVNRWEQIQRVLLFAAEGKALYVEVERPGLKEHLKLRIEPLPEIDRMKSGDYIGMRAGKAEVAVAKILPDSVQDDNAVKGDKLQNGDIIRTAMGIPIDDPEQLNQIISESCEPRPDETGAAPLPEHIEPPAAKPVPMTIERNGETLQESVVTRVKGYYRPGFRWYRKPVVGTVQALSPAAMAGIQAGDVITEVDYGSVSPETGAAAGEKHEAQRWLDVEYALGMFVRARQAHPNDPALKSVCLMIKRGSEGSEQTLQFDIVPDNEQETLAKQAEAEIYNADSFAAEMLGIAPKGGLYVWDISPDSPLATAEPVNGARIEKGDKILAIGRIDLSDDNVIISGKELTMLLSALFPANPEDGGAKKTMLIVYQKPGEAKDGPFHQIGIWNPPVEYRAWLEIETAQTLDKSSLSVDKENVGGALTRGVIWPFDIVVLTYQSVVAMVEGLVSPDQLSGPVGILQMSYKSAQMGISSFLWFLAVISVSLAVLNILPIPVLDGGHVAFLVAEKVRGKPVSEKVRGRLEMLGLALLLGLVVFATWNDIFSRLLGH